MWLFLSTSCLFSQKNKFQALVTPNWKIIVFNCSYVWKWYGQWAAGVFCLDLDICPPVPCPLSSHSAVCLCKISLLSSVSTGDPPTRGGKRRYCGNRQFMFSKSPLENCQKHVLLERRLGSPLKKLFRNASVCLLWSLVSALPVLTLVENITFVCNLKWSFELSVVSDAERRRNTIPSVCESSEEGSQAPPIVDFNNNPSK